MIYHKDGSYIYITPESPKGMEGVLFLAYEGPGPGAMKETVIPLSKVNGWERQPMTNSWRKEFGLPIEAPSPPPPEPQFKQQLRRPEPQVIEKVVIVKQTSGFAVGVAVFCSIAMFLMFAVLCAAKAEKGPERPPHYQKMIEDRENECEEILRKMQERDLTTLESGV